MRRKLRNVAHGVVRISLTCEPRNDINRDIIMRVFGAQVALFHVAEIKEWFEIPFHGITCG